MSSINRKLANLITSTGDVATFALDNAASMQVFSSVDSLPTSSLSAGDQALVGTRLYISNGSGWYNVALINATPRLTIDPTGAVSLANDGTTPTVITLTGTDSDNADANLIYSAESDGNFGGLATLSQDSSVFTITPLGVDSATTASSTLTFKVSDGINFGSGTTTFTLSFTVADANYTRLLVKADAAGTDNQVDASTNNHTITENGNVTSTAFTPYHPGGYSGYFTTNSQRIYTNGNSSDFNLSNSNWTYESWFYVPSSHTFSSYPRIFGLGPSYHDTKSFGVMVADPDHSGYMTVYWNDGTLGRKLISATTYEKDKWNHVAVCREGNAVALFYNGTRIANNASYTGTINGNNTYAFVGTTDHGTDPEGFVGYWKDVRLVKGSSVYDPTASSIIVPDEPLTAVTNTKLLLASTPYLADASPSAHSLIDGGHSFKRFGPYDYSPYTKADHGGSVYFDGSGDYLAVASDASLAVGTGDFTIEFWANWTAWTGNQRMILMGQVGTSNIEISRDAGSDVLNVYISGGSIINYTWNPGAGVWHHIALVRTGTGTNGVTLYINGVNVATGTSATNISANNFFIGGLSWATGYNMHGYIADVRFVSGTAVYTSTFTPSTEPLTAIANTSLLTCTNKNDIWEQGSGSLLLTKVGNTTASNTQRKFTGSSAIYLDGSGDYITYPGSDFDVFPEDFTIEWWQYWASNVSGYGTIYDNNYTTSPNLLIQTNDPGNVNQYKVFMAGISTILIESSAASTGQWYHYALVRNGSTITMYRNGTSTGSVTLSGSIGSSAGTKGIGAASNGNYPMPESYIQDFRITKGLARYTSAFTPPTAEFEG